MSRKDLLQVLIVAVCLVLLSSGIALAGAGEGQSSSEGGIAPARLPAFRPEPSPDDEIAHRHWEIDRYLFVDHVEKIEQLDFVITHTAPRENWIEIGILPFTGENAAYLYGILGDDRVQVVEGQQPQLLPAAPNMDADPDDVVSSGEKPSPGSSAVTWDGGEDAPDATRLPAFREEPSPDDEIAHKHWEIDKYLFLDHPDETARLGFRVTHTGPGEEWVEIGIMPFSEESADYLYDLFGDEMVRVVEGQQAQTLLEVSASPGVEIDATGTDLQDDVAGTRLPALPSFLLGILVIVAGGGIVVWRRAAG